MDSEKTIESQFNVALGYLLDAAGDKELTVRESVCKSLQALSKEYGNEIVTAICCYRQKNAKLSENHLFVLMSVLEQIAQEKRNAFPEEILSRLIQFSIEELQKNDSTHSTHELASNILICLGSYYCSQVLDVLLPKLQPGCEPNSSVLMSLGHLACANVSQCVPVIKVALNIMIPMMTSARNEQSRIAFAFVVGKFSEAILEYMASNETDRDAAVTKETFAEEITSAYNVIANLWIHAKEIKVTESAIYCLGPLFSLLPEEKANASTSRAIFSLISAYKRPCIPHHLITQCLATILSSAPPSAIQAVFDQILYTLGNMVVVPPDFSLPHTVKQHSEVLRCYDHIGAHFGEKLCDLVLKHLRMGNEKEKVESLIIISHLISGNDNILGSRMNEITSAVRSVLQDPSIKVKKALVKTIISLSYKGYAQDGSDFIEFLVRHCATLPNHIGMEYTELSEICSSTIHLLSSTVEDMRDLLWVTLLKLMTDPTYDHAVPIAAKALTQLAPKLDPKHSQQLGEPNRDLVLCRCFSLLGSPLNSNRGPSILCFLQHFSPYVSVYIADLWAHKLPQLINYLQVSEWSETEWDSLLLEMINNTVTTISCHEVQWPISMSRHLSTLLMSCVHDDEANVILSSLAITTAVIEDKQIVSEHLDTILSRFKISPNNTKECARAVGILSTAHLDMVLARLEAIAQSELNKRNSRLLGLMKDSKADAEMEKCRECLLESYAAIAHRCPLMELLPKLDMLTTWITTQISVAKEQSGRNAALEAILNCAESLIRHKTEAKHTIKCRTNVLNVVLQLIQQNKPDPLTIKVVTALVKLPPSLVSEARLHILKSCFDRILSQEPPSNGYDTSTSMQTLKQLGELVEELLLDSVTPDRLDEITTLLDPWIKHRNWHQRLSAITVFRTTLLAYYHNMHPGYQNPSTFNQCGDLVGSLVVRYFDSVESIGRIAGHCAGILLAIANVYEGHSHDPNIERIFDKLPEENTSWYMTKILCNKLSHSQLHKLTGRLLDGLTDVDQTACSNASDILASVFKLKGAELLHYVNDILGSLLLQLVSSGSHPTNGVNAVLALALHHPKLVVNILLKQPLPLHPSLSDCWKAIASDNNLSSFALDHILQILATANLFDEESKSPNRPKIAAFQPLAAVSGLSEMVMSTLISDLLKSSFPQLLPSLMTLLAAYIGSSPPILSPSPNKTIVINRDAYKIIPARVVKDCLQRVLIVVGCEPAAEALASTSQLQHIESLVSSIPQLTVSVCQTFPHLLPKLMVSLNQYASTTCEPQRIIITAFYAECLAVQCSRGGDVGLIDSIVSSLLSAITAPDQTVRSIALHGLSYISNLPHLQMKRHEDSVLAALMQGLDDTDGSLHTRIPMEAMQSLSTLIPVVEPATLNRIQVAIALRVKPFFEKEEIALRCISLRLFGQLCCQDNSVQVGYQEQVHSCLICLLLHLSEPEPSIVKACKYTLRQIGPVLGAEKVSTMFQDHLIDEGALQYENFVTTLIKSIVESLEDLAVNMFNTCLNYMKSNWPNIRGNAALIAGLLYKNFSKESKSSVSLEPMTTRLINLISDPNFEVRAKAVRSLAMVFSS
ncbi:maestro heat like repeat family protein c11.1 isoform X1 [Rhodnius prolixus]